MLQSRGKKSNVQPVSVPYVPSRWRMRPCHQGRATDTQTRRRKHKGTVKTLSHKREIKYMRALATAKMMV